MNARGPGAVPRRAALAAGVGFGISGVGGYFATRTDHGWLPAGFRRVPLRSECVAWLTPSTRELIPAGRTGDVVPGTRISVRADDWEPLAEREAHFLAASASSPAVREDGTLIRDALLDLHVLSAGLRAPIGSYAWHWRYAWPRDVAHMAAALAVAGHRGPAVEALAFFGGVPVAGNCFHARYRPDTGIPPDGRPPQADGAGWLLWGCAMVLAAARAGERAGCLERLRRTIEVASDLALASVAGPSGLPEPTPDYWELPVRGLTLGVVAPIAMGLHHGVALNAALGRAIDAERCRGAADRLTSRIWELFARNGFQRYPGGGGADVIITALLPPYAPAGHPDVLERLAATETAVRAPAGGLRPGAAWPRDGVSWTPATLLVAQAWAAAGEVGRARALVDWVAAHRTGAGSIPEKVLYDGRPAEVAPLGWSSALAVLTAYALNG